MTTPTRAGACGSSSPVSWWSPWWELRCCSPFEVPDASRSAWPLAYVNVSSASTLERSWSPPRGLVPFHTGLMVSRTRESHFWMFHAAAQRRESEAWTRQRQWPQATGDRIHSHRDCRRSNGRYLGQFDQPSVRTRSSVRVASWKRPVLVDGLHLHDLVVSP